jgi:ferric iron reductase protein FhuF
VAPTVNRVGTGSLAEALAAAVAKLGRFGASYPIYLEAPTGEEVHPAAELFATRNLRRFCERSIAEWTIRPDVEDIRAAASRFMRRYCGSMATAALVPLAHGVAFDLSIDRVAVLIRSEMPMGVVLDPAGAAPFGSPRRPTLFPIATRPLPTVAALREAALVSLVGDNLAPAFEHIMGFAQLNPKVLWATTAEQIDLLFEDAVVGHDARELAPYAEDREAILFGPMLPGVDGPNPMLDLLTWEEADDPQFPRPLQVRQICCVCYVIPGRDTYCRTCGLLTPQERLELWRAWRAAASGARA